MPRRVMAAKMCLFLVIIMAGSGPAAAQGRNLTPLQQWHGRLDKARYHQHPLDTPVIESQKELDTLWAAWGSPGEMPRVDFQTQLLLAATCTCSIIKMAPRLDDAGNLSLGVTMTKDLTPDVGWVMVLVPRQGIRSVAGKILKN